MNPLTSLPSSNVGKLPDAMLQGTYEVQQKDFYELNAASPTATSLEGRLQQAFVRDAQKEAGHAEAMRTMVSRFEIQSNPYLHLLSVTAQHSVEIQVKSALAKKFTNIFDTLLK